jgi:hypothetical protein
VPSRSRTLTQRLTGSPVSISIVCNDRHSVAITYKCLNAWRWYWLSTVRAGNRGHVDNNKQAVETGSLFNEYVPPPRNNNPRIKVNKTNNMLKFNYQWPSI